MNKILISIVLLIILFGCTDRTLSVCEVQKDPIKYSGNRVIKVKGRVVNPVAIGIKTFELEDLNGECKSLTVTMAKGVNPKESSIITVTGKLDEVFNNKFRLIVN